jgi:hypothetical protein
VSVLARRGGVSVIKPLHSCPQDSPQLRSTIEKQINKKKEGEEEEEEEEEEEDNQRTTSQHLIKLSGRSNTIGRYRYHRVEDRELTHLKHMSGSVARAFCLFSPQPPTGHLGMDWSLSISMEADTIET